MKIEITISDAGTCICAIGELDELQGQSGMELMTSTESKFFPVPAMELRKLAPLLFQRVKKVTMVFESVEDGQV